MKKILVYTDGSCIGNPGPGGWGFLLVEGEKTATQKIIFSDSGYDFDTTNNRMEMSAFLEAIKYLSKNFSSQHVQIFSDSNLLVQSINQNWKRKANQDLWQQIDKFLPLVNIKLDWVKAHHIDKYNNECDAIAQAAAQTALKKMSAKNFVKKIPSQKPAENKSGQASLF